MAPKNPNTEIKALVYTEKYHFAIGYLQKFLAENRDVDVETKIEE